jgi:hypothetical protein
MTQGFLEHQKMNWKLLDVLRHMTDDLASKKKQHDELGEVIHSAPQHGKLITERSPSPEDAFLVPRSLGLAGGCVVVADASRNVCVELEVSLDTVGWSTGEVCT